MKNFTKDGNVYKLKPQLGMYIPLFVLFGGATLLGFLKIPESSFKWWMLGIAILMLFSYLTSFLIIDLDKKEINAKSGLLTGTKTLPLSALNGFTIHKLKQMGFITTNVTLLANYTKNGKEKEMGLIQSFFTGPIQSILNDIDEILGDEHKR